MCAVLGGQRPAYVCAVLGGQRACTCVSSSSVRGSEGLHVCRLVLGGQRPCMCVSSSSVRASACVNLPGPRKTVMEPLVRGASR